MPYPLASPDILDSVVYVHDRSGLMGDLNPAKLYWIDGAIDMGDQSIVVPEGGLQISGLGFDVSSLSADGTLFVGPGTHSGNLQIKDLSLTAPQVFDLDNAGNGGAVECLTVNFVNCATLGELTAYRQGLWNGVGVIFCDDGLTMSGTWSGGFASLASIVIGGFPGTVFKAGTGLSVQGSFRSDVNALGIAPTGSFCDFAPANITSDGAFSMEGVRVPDGVTGFPNMPQGARQARFRNCLGQLNTYPGGSIIVDTDGVTNVILTDTLYEIAATGVGSDLAWVTVENGRRLVYASSQPIEVDVQCELSFSGGNNDQIGVQIRRWVADPGVYENIGPAYTTTMNGGLLGTRAENVTSTGSTVLRENDRIELWLKNLSGTGNITTLAGGRIYMKER